MAIHTDHLSSARFHPDLSSVDLASEDLLIRRRMIAVSRPPQRDVERLAAVEARLAREAGR